MEFAVSVAIAVAIAVPISVPISIPVAIAVTVAVPISVPISISVAIPVSIAIAFAFAFVAVSISLVITIPIAVIADALAIAIAITRRTRPAVRRCPIAIARFARRPVIAEAIIIDDSIHTPNQAQHCEHIYRRRERGPRGDDEVGGERAQLHTTVVPTGQDQITPSCANVDQRAVSANERILFESPSMFDELTVTERDDGVRTLWFGRERIHHGDCLPGHADHFELQCFPTMLAALSQAAGLHRILMIGLGAAVLPSFVHAFLPESSVDVVEIDPLVVEVAERFFELRPDERLRIWIADGRQFLIDCREPYDAIMLDGHGLLGVVPHLATREFFTLVGAALRPNGLVVANIWGRAANPDFDATIATYLDSFASVYVLEVDGHENDIMLAFPRPCALLRDAAEARARSFSAEHQLPLDLGDHVLGFDDAAQLGIRARILRDPPGSG